MYKFLYVAHYNQDVMKRRLLLLFLIIFSFTFFYPVNTVFADSNYVYLGGFPAGFSLEERGARIVGVSDVITNDGIKSPAKEIGIDKGDLILAIDDYEVNNPVDIENALTNGESKLITLKRKGETYYYNVKPAKDLNGKYRLGIFVRDSINGVGTVTYVKDDVLAALGHPVLNSDGSIMEIIKGNIYKCTIINYKAGERGIPGELKGAFNAINPIGNIIKNVPEGIFAKLNQDLELKDKIEIGKPNMGSAEIYTTISGNTPIKYSINIIKTDDSLSTKNLVIKVTDNSLLESTGGIVQGMSGSPIIQNGKLVGAVTHVFINDPTMGYGIGINNMLNQI